MQRLLPAPWCALALAFASCSGGDEAPTPVLAGAWTPRSAQLGGQELPIETFQGANLNLTADAYEFLGDRGSYALLPGSTPAALDIRGVEGPNAGRTIPAIYRLDGDRLTVCYQLGEGARPTEFASPAGSQVFLVSYERLP